MSESLLLTHEVARHLRVNADTIRRMVREHRLPSVRVGRKILVPAESLANLLHIAPRPAA